MTRRYACPKCKAKWYRDVSSEPPHSGTLRKLFCLKCGNYFDDNEGWKAKKDLEECNHNFQRIEKFPYKCNFQMKRMKCRRCGQIAWELRKRIGWKQARFICPISQRHKDIVSIVSEKDFERLLDKGVIRW